MMQIILLAYVRHSLTFAPAEGARYASLIDVSAAQAIAHTEVLISTSLSATYAQNVALDQSMQLGVPTAVVTVQAPFPALGLWSVGGHLRVTAHAPLEYVR